MSLSKTMSQVCNGPLYLSDFLQKGNIDDAYRNSRVHLPGLELESYSGYITVDNIDNRNLFFWFFPSTKVPPHQAPLVVYLNGGPGNSSLIGLFEEVGPLKVDEYGQVSKREITWTDQFSMIFIDSPVGVGFSYCDPGKDVKTNSVVADDLCNFLIQFLQLFPEYQNCDVYLGGISYAGKYVPAFADKIHNMTASTVRINLKGIFIGSGLCDPGKMLPHYPDLLLSLGMITEKKAKSIKKKLTNAVEKQERDGKFEEAFKEITKIVFSDSEKHLGFKTVDNALITKNYNWKFAEFLNKSEIQNAIHVKETKYASETTINMDEDFIKGVGSELSNLIDNYKVLIYNGQFDLAVSVQMTEVLLKQLPCFSPDDYLASKKQKWVTEGGDIAGYVTKVKNFTRVVMRNAGHRTAIDQPGWTMDMMVKFIQDKSFHS